jgi:hypothetical protein
MKTAYLIEYKEKGMQWMSGLVFFSREEAVNHADWFVYTNKGVEYNIAEYVDNSEKV